MLLLFAATVLSLTSAPTFQLTDAETRELAAYTAASNAVRNQISDVHRQPESPERQQKLDELNARARVIDDQATPVARAVEARGFWAMSAPRDPRTDDTVMLIVSHSGDLALQKQTVLQVAPLVAAHKYQPDAYSALYDRVQVGQGLPQHYGTQMQCVDHRYVPYKMDDAADIEAVRKAAGLMETEAQYLAYFQGMVC